jgi:hypothetical protein
MPEILNAADEIERWFTLPANKALALQKPLPEGRCASSRPVKGETGRDLTDNWIAASKIWARYNVGGQFPMPRWRGFMRTYTS